jgi:hypothetical protein
LVTPLEVSQDNDDVDDDEQGIRVGKDIDGASITFDAFVTLLTEDIDDALLAAEFNDDDADDVVDDGVSKDDDSRVLLCAASMASIKRDLPGLTTGRGWLTEDEMKSCLEASLLPVDGPWVAFDSRILNTALPVVEGCGGGDEGDGEEGVRGRGFSEMAKASAILRLFKAAGVKSEVPPSGAKMLFPGVITVPEKADFSAADVGVEMLPTVPRTLVALEATALLDRPSEGLAATKTEEVGDVSASVAIGKIVLSVPSASTTVIGLPEELGEIMLRVAVTAVDAAGLSLSPLPERFTKNVLDLLPGTSAGLKKMPPAPDLSLARSRADMMMGVKDEPSDSGFAGSLR